MIVIASSTCIQWRSLSDSTRTEQGVGVLCIDSIKGVSTKKDVSHGKPGLDKHRINGHGR